jgi:two-component system osmolarity sensor histidine kinase EnvZ
VIANSRRRFRWLGDEFTLDLGHIEPFPFRPIAMMRMLMN